MKKAKSMRVAVGILALTLITSCFVGGTFAKYTTKGEAADTARVAAFGVQINASGSLFNTQYSTDDKTNPEDTEGNKITISVNSSNDDKVVAPGTTNTDKLTFGVTGTPEVAVQVKFAIADGYTDVILPAGDYPDQTTNVADKTFNLAKEYRPSRFTLAKDGAAVTGADKVTLPELMTVLNGLTENYAPNTNLANAIGSYTLTWEWVFENAIDGDTDYAIVDAADTYLGNLMNSKLANPTEFTAPAGVSLDVAFKMSISVTQID